MKGIARRAVRSSGAGLLPWIPVALVTSPEHLGWALAVSLTLSILILAATIWVSDPIKNLEIIDVCYFVITALIYILAAPTFASELSRWIAEASALVILVYAAGSLVVGRPFTMQYTSVYVSDGHAGTADFARANRAMSAMWAIVFGIELACLIISKSVLARPDDLLFGWLIPIGVLVVGFIVNARMTRTLLSRYDPGAVSPVDPQREGR